MVTNDVIEFLRARERIAYDAWLASPPELSTVNALKWHAALRAVDDELQARARLAAMEWRP